MCIFATFLNNKNKAKLTILISNIFSFFKFNFCRIVSVSPEIWKDSDAKSSKAPFVPRLLNLIFFPMRKFLRDEINENQLSNIRRLRGMRQRLPVKFANFFWSFGQSDAWHCRSGMAFLIFLNKFLHIHRSRAFFH